MRLRNTENFVRTTYQIIGYTVPTYFVGRTNHWYNLQKKKWFNVPI